MGYDPTILNIRLPMSQEADYYAILGIDRRGTAEMIRVAFTTRLNNFPGDIDPASNPAYQQILQAYKVLSNPKRRAVYDALLNETMPYELNVDVELSRERLKITDSAQLIYAQINIHTPEQDIKSRNPLNLCLVIDHSTSMRGARLDRVISAVELVLGKLTPDDLISVIGFSDRAEVVAPSGHVENLNVLSARVRGMEAFGGTEIHQGLAAGVRELKKVSLVNHTNHLILLTDGHTYGDVDECLALAQEAASQGIAFSGMGIGTEWNDQFLDQLVAPSGGQSVFIETPAEILHHLQTQIKGLGQVYARNVRMVPKFPRSVMLQYGFKLAPFAQPIALNSDQIVLGDIEGHAPLSFLLELVVAPQQVENRINVAFQFLADVPSQQLQNRAFNRQVQFLVMADPPEALPPRALVKAVRMLNMCRMNEKVWDAVESGRLDQAATRMRHLSTRLLEIGQTRLAQQAHVEMERLATMGTLSPEGRKKIKFGTRALLAQANESWIPND